MPGLLKEQKSTECKEKESVDASGNSSDGQTELRKSIESLPKVSQGQSKDISLSKASDYKPPVTSERMVSKTEEMENSPTTGTSHRESEKQHVARHGVSFVS